MFPRLRIKKFVSVSGSTYIFQEKTELSQGCLKKIIQKIKIFVDDFSRT